MELRHPVNLLANALKFTDHGSVTLKIGTVGDSQKNRLRFEVEDTGCGIPAERLTDIFEPFSQVEDTGQMAGGTGLGLAISQRLAAALEGTLEVESHVGKGSRFFLTLPISKCDDESPIVQFGDTPNGPCRRVLAPDQELTVLVADDNPTNRDLLVTLLQRSGIHTLEAENGEAAIT